MEEFRSKLQLSLGTRILMRDKSVRKRIWAPYLDCSMDYLGVLGLARLCAIAASGLLYTGIGGVNDYMDTWGLMQGYLHELAKRPDSL